jgi:sugar-specific transcriptional regulator TrmB
MDIQTLTSIGLTQSQAKAYLVLVQYGSVAPPELALRTKETRTNAYKILDRLVDLGLALKEPGNKKMIYRANNPIALEALAKKARDEALERESKVKSSLPTLLSFFYTYSEQPGVRFFQGAEGLKEIFNDMLRTRQTIYLVRSPDDIKFYDADFFQKFKDRRAKLGIKTYALTPDLPGINHNKSIDEKNLFTRTWLPSGAYDSSVEWDVYGDKLAIISYGEEAIGASFKQLFNLMQLR